MTAGTEASIVESHSSIAEALLQLVHGSIVTRGERYRRRPSKVDSGKNQASPDSQEGDRGGGTSHGDQAPRSGGGEEG
jgi:hypothetical protein